MWVAIAAVLQVSESFFPHPVPGLKFGFANMVTLVIMANYGFKPALKVALLRTVISSFIIGTFLSPAFIMSFLSALTSTLAMGLLFRIPTVRGNGHFSLIGISVFGALFHNTTQLLLAYLLLIRHSGIFVFLPWLLIGAVITGVITGILAREITLRLVVSPASSSREYIKDYPENEESFAINAFQAGGSFIHKLKPEIKIAALIIISFIVLAMENMPLYLIIAAAIVITAALSDIPPGKLFMGTKKILPLVIVSFLIPVFFSGFSRGLYKGILFSLKIIILSISAALLAATTSIEKLEDGFKKLLAKLKLLKIDPDRTAKIISLSWKWVPELWKELRCLIRFMRSGQKRSLKDMIALLADFFVYLFSKETTI